jgi:ArsR family transcriptional regulator
MQVSNPEVFDLHAAFCQMLANAKRLMMLDMVGKREMSVGEIAESLGVKAAAVSQHLRLLRHQHMVLTRREGQTIYYRLAHPRMIEACHIIRSILMENMRSRGRLAVGVRVDQLITDLPVSRDDVTTRRTRAAPKRVAQPRRKRA